MGPLAEDRLPIEPQAVLIAIIFARAVEVAACVRPE